ncbi:tail fiber protein 3 [Burkholderia phage CSP3]|nr:tail fiber protein 3 [Burkholderia phage CSP3]
MALKLSNNAVGFLAGTLDPDSTTLALQPGQGAAFPVLSAGDWCPGTLVHSSGAVEVVRVIARSSDTFTIERAQEGTGPQQFNPGDRFEHRLTAGALMSIVGDVDGLSAAIARIQPRVGDLKIWTGAIADIPAVHGPGWYLADGQHGTIDLRDKFIVAAGGSYAPGNTGGAATVALTAAQMPQHNHGVNDPGHAHGVNDPSHAHSVYDPGHTHSHNTAALVQSSTGGGAFPINGYSGGTISGAYTGISIYGAYSGISIQGAGTGISTQNAGSGAAHENRPPYYALAIIQYVGA